MHFKTKTYLYHHFRVNYESLKGPSSILNWPWKVWWKALILSHKWQPFFRKFLKKTCQFCKLQPVTRAYIYVPPQRTRWEIPFFELLFTSMSKFIRRLIKAKASPSFNIFMPGANFSGPHYTFICYCLFEALSWRQQEVRLELVLKCCLLHPKTPVAHLYSQQHAQGTNGRCCS